MKGRDRRERSFDTAESETLVAEIGSILSHYRRVPCFYRLTWVSQHFRLLSLAKVG